MAKDKTYYQLIPEKVYNDLTAISESIRPGIKGFCPDNLKEVISIVACHIRKDEGCTPLKMKYIKRLVPQGQLYLAGLIDLGIILRSGQYIPGAACYQYDFAPEYKSKYKALPLFNAKLILRIRTVWDQVRKESAKTIRGRSEQTGYLKQLTIAEGYNEFIESNYASETDQYNSIAGSATRIMNGDIYYSIDNTSGRFHSNITNMAKGLRPYLRIKGEPLVNIDVKNSQPYLSTIILTDPGKVSWMTQNPAFALLLQTLKVSLNHDVKKYILLVISGQLYEYLMDAFRYEGIELTRDETKRQVLRILFARNRTPKDEINRKARQIFKDRFPTVHRIFSKVRGHCKGDKFENFKRFSILLQSIESYLMLDVILKRIYKELPGTIAVTIHDSVMTGILTNNVEAVRQIITEELTYFVGFQPQIKIEEKKKGKERERVRSDNMVNTTIHYVSTNSVSLN
jgi:hypothetical protein